MSVSAAAVKELRDKTGISMMACKKALEENDGNMEAAIESLRKRGAAVAQKRAGHDAKEGKIVAGRSGNTVAVVEITAETDFSAGNADFIAYADKVLKATLADKPADLEALLQAKADGVSVQELTNEIVGKISENITVKRFFLYEVKEGETAATYVHGQGRIGVSVVLSHAGTASNDALQELAKDLCLQVAAFSPIALNEKDVPEDVIAKEREINMEQAKNEGLPEAKLPMVVEGRIRKFLKEVVLVDQLYVKDNKTPINKVVAEVAKAAGAPSLKIDRFVRFQVGA